MPRYLARYSAASALAYTAWKERSRSVERLILAPMDRVSAASAPGGQTPETAERNLSATAETASRVVSPDSRMPN